MLSFAFTAQLRSRMHGSHHANYQFSSLSSGIDLNYFVKRLDDVLHKKCACSALNV